jgi:hypothetical protein
MEKPPLAELISSLQILPRPHAPPIANIKAMCCPNPSLKGKLAGRRRRATNGDAVCHDQAKLPGWDCVQPLISSWRSKQLAEPVEADVQIIGLFIHVRWRSKYIEDLG